MDMKKTGLAAFAAVGLLVSGAEAGVPLVRNGEARAVIVLAADASGTLTNAAAEITNHIRQISGAALSVIPGGAPVPKGTTALYLGGAAGAELEGLIRKQGTFADSFALVAKGDSISIRGLSDEGTLYGVYELLEQLGVRWFMPGELGTVIPSARDLEVAEQSTVQVPSFNNRRLSGGAPKAREWTLRMRQGGAFFPPAHGVHMPKDYTFEKHPEYFALIGGERKNRQLCVSNPEVVKGAVQSTLDFFRKNPDAPWIGMGPHDGRGFCECGSCKALDAGDWDPFAAVVSMTDRYLWFFNQILEGIASEFPDKKIAFYAYASYNRPPVNVKPNPRIVPAFAPITLCRVHDIGNPICAEKNIYQRWLIGEWSKIIPEVYDRGYWFNLADPGLTFPMVHRVRVQIPVSKELGITGWRVETIGHWASETPSLYLASKLMWNHKADADALLRDFYASFFGPAAAPMARHLARLDEAVGKGDFHTGSSYPIPNLYPPALRKQAKADLAEAARLAGEGLYGRRVKLFTEGFAYTEAFIDMMEKRGANDWKGAKAALDRMDELKGILTAYKPAMINKEYADSYMKRFFRPCTEQGYERAAGTNGVFVAGLDDQWLFQQDPDGLGDSLGWFMPELSGGNWRSIRTSSLSWSDQGLRYYKNDAWYRQSLPIDPKWKGKKVMIWFGGVDEKARVWVNGKLLGESPGRAFIPFEMDASAAIQPGKTNQVTVWVSNKTLNEVGTGGITAPVFLYAPVGAPTADGGKAEDVTPVEFR